MHKKNIETQEHERTKLVHRVRSEEPFNNSALKGTDQKTRRSIFEARKQKKTENLTRRLRYREKKIDVRTNRFCVNCNLSP